MVMAMKHVFTPYFEDHKELQDFAEWAFGPNYLKFYGYIDFIYSWNDLHSDLLTLNMNGSINEESKIMVTLWKENKKTT